MSSSATTWAWRGYKEGVDNPHELAADLAERAVERYDDKESQIGAEQLRELERFVMLRVIDTRWMDHLLEMDYLREGIGLRAMGQRDPLVEYKGEAYEMFSTLVQAINEDFLRTILHIEVVVERAGSRGPAVGSHDLLGPERVVDLRGRRGSGWDVRRRGSFA